MTAGVKFPIRPVLELYGATNLPTKHGWAKIKCVLHDDGSPSASFSDEKQAFRCFTCDVYGDAIDLIRMKEGLDYQRAVERGTEITGQEGVPLSGSTVQRRSIRPARLSDRGSRPDDGNAAAVPVGRRRQPRRIG